MDQTLHQEAAQALYDLNFELLENGTRYEVEMAVAQAATFDELPEPVQARITINRANATAP